MSKSLFKVLPLHDRDLRPERIDIWQIPLNIEPSWAKSLLNEQETARANRYYFPRHQRRFTIARAMLRVILAHYLGKNPQALVFDYLKQGKPYLRHHESLQFNLSHSEDTALLAVGQDYPMGIDIEYFSARSYHGIARHSFSQQENECLSHLPQAILPLAFFNIWAQKEAFIKAIGLGLSYPTQQFDVPLLPDKPAILVDSLHQQHWQMLAFIPEAACCAALCCHPDILHWHYHALRTLPETPTLLSSKPGTP